MGKRSSWLAVFTLLLGSSTGLASGGWMTQEFNVVAGWNLVWIAVEPSPAANDPASVFGANAASVCVFIPATGIGSEGVWRCFHRDQPPFVSSLTDIQGDRGYFVLADSAGPISVTGRPLRRSRPQSGGKPALFGAGVATGGQPTFGDYFTIGDAVDRITRAFQFDPQSEYSEVVNIPAAMIGSNGVYWLTSNVDLDYAGPLRAQTPATGLQFGTRQYSLDLTIEIPAGTPSVSVSVLASDSPPAGEPSDASGGDTSWLQYRDAMNEWQSFSGALNVTVPANETEVVLVLRADRSGRPAASIDRTGNLYQALIQIEDGAGHSEVIGAGMEVLDATVGTWVGEVTLDTVTLHSALADQAPALGSNAAEPMRFSLLLEISTNGPARLLDKICVPTDATFNTDGSVDSYTRYKTFRTVMFPDSVMLDAGLSGAVDLPSDHPLNPYRHRYNPQHLLGYDIQRAVDLDIMTADPAPVNPFLGNLLSERAGNNVLVGMYYETITGLSAESIDVAGTFRLVRLSEDTGLRDCPQ